MSVVAVRLGTSDIPTVNCKRWATVISIALADIVGLGIASLLVVLARSALTGHLAFGDFAPLLPAPALVCTLFALLGLYPGIALNPAEELRRVVGSASLTYLIIVSGLFLVKETNVLARIPFVLAWIFSIVLVLGCRAAVRKHCSRLSWWGVPTVIIGADNTGYVILESLRRQPTLGLRPIALLDDVFPNDSRRQAAGLVTGGLELAPRLAEDFGPAYLIIAMPGLSSRALASLTAKYAQRYPHVLIIPDLFGVSSLWVSPKDIGGMLGLEVNQKLVQQRPQAVKRGLDLLLTILGAILLSPLLACIYVAIKTTSRGPALYGQLRIGRNNKPFKAWKFRSMVMNADMVLQDHLNRSPELRDEWAQTHKLKKDPRVTAVGRILRKSSLDELPQIWNVFLGQMSLVGPRPIVAAEIAKYGDYFHVYKRVSPGLTGLWQISGRNNTTYKERVDFDEYYVRNWSIWLDFYILARTVKTVLLAEGAY